MTLSEHKEGGKHFDALPRLQLYASKRRRNLKGLYRVLYNSTDDTIYKEKRDMSGLLQQVKAHICDKMDDYDIIFSFRKRSAPEDESGPSTSGVVAKKSKAKTSFGDFSSW